MAYDIFVSYAREDLDRVRPIVRVLARRGWRVWWDRKLLAGKPFTASIRNELQTSKAVVVIWSEKSLKSDWVESEAHYGMEHKVLVPVRLTEIDPPFPFGRIQAVDHFLDGEPTGEVLALLVRSLENLIGKPIVHTEEQPTARIPTVPQIQPAAHFEPDSSPPIRATGMPGRVTHKRRRLFILAAVSLVAMLGLGWIYQVATDRKAKPGPRPPGFLVVSPVDEETDPVFGSRLPAGWASVDGTPGYDGWATSVREPRCGIVMKLIPPGDFVMGSPDGEIDRRDDEAQHRVQISYPFYLGVTEVTMKEMYRLLDVDSDDTRPVSVISWQDASEFCHEIGCELPTEAQWEYAARAGGAARWWWGDSPELGVGKANVLDWSASSPFETPPQFPFDDKFIYPAPVGQFEPNPFGLQDMIGNVWEWVLDSYAPYDTKELRDPRVENNREGHIARGGSYCAFLDETRVAKRLFTTAPLVRRDKREMDESGFRVAFNLR